MMAEAVLSLAEARTASCGKNDAVALWLDFPSPENWFL